MELPRYAESMPVGKFKKFLMNCGGQLLHEESKYEVIRLRKDNDGFEILYKRDDGKLQWTKEFIKAYMAYKSGGKVRWRASRRRKVSRKRSPALIRTIFRRDGHVCWFCTCPLDMYSATIDHILNVSHGGNNHICNLTVACNPCNQKARNMSIPEKIVLMGKLTKRYQDLKVKQLERLRDSGDG